MRLYRIKELVNYGRTVRMIDHGEHEPEQEGEISEAAQFHYGRLVIYDHDNVPPGNFKGPRYHILLVYGNGLAKNVGMFDDGTLGAANVTRAGLTFSLLEQSGVST